MQLNRKKRNLNQQQQKKQNDKKLFMNVFNKTKNEKDSQTRSHFQKVHYHMHEVACSKTEFKMENKYKELKSNYSLHLNFIKYLYSNYPRAPRVYNMYKTTP